MDLFDYKVVDRVMGVPFRSARYSELYLGSYRTLHNSTSIDHALLYAGEIERPAKPVLLRINSACFTSDLFHDERCDCNWQLQRAIDLVAASGLGLIIYHLHHEGRGLGFHDKLKTYQLMESEGLTTHDASARLGRGVDLRFFVSSALIIHHLRIGAVNLLTNNPDKRTRLEKCGIKVKETIPLVTTDTALRPYLDSKRRQFGHLIDLPS